MYKFLFNYLGPNQRVLEGTVVAWCPSDSNDGELVQVVFDDKSASTTLTVGEFNQCRAAYIAVHPYDRSISEEAKERRENERRERGVGRGGREVRGGRGGRSIGRGAIDPVRQNSPQLAEVPLLPPTNQRAAQASAVRELPTGGANNSIECGFIHYSRKRRPRRPEYWPRGDRSSTP